ncbi:hypothetical protein [Streptomyces mirabilis]|uniref:Uncharacterized protein n=1 Tax=Streptomyces mirabilis TaxID=68239 RepID=A0ABU3V6C0_9ACTN|nr:hypothetical protein [Streptomyces mirabilis]MCX5357033.1 hypothetical protein [Streptomyces mirabilis]MDU9001570.1 hypothetical protein [Streptomyces mirabilis]
MHVLVVAQSATATATARALGGPEVREQLATRILARYSMNAWRMLALEIHPAPKSTKHPGRAKVVISGTARETQVLFFTDAEACGPPASRRPRREEAARWPRPLPPRSRRPLWSADRTRCRPCPRPR